jgi:hypothetical protein
VSQTNERRHRHRTAIALVAVLAAFFAATMMTATSASADTKACNIADYPDITGYLACLNPPAGDNGGGTGSAVGSAVVQGSDLPVTGSDPVRTIVIGSAFIVVGAAAVIGSLQARRRSRISS